MAKLEKKPTWTCVVAVALEDSDGRWLMHQRPESKHHGGLWEFPGGKVEAKEVPVKALIREIDEELGLALDTCDLTPVCFAEHPLQPGEARIGYESQRVAALHVAQVRAGGPFACGLDAWQ